MDGFPSVGRGLTFSLFLSGLTGKEWPAAIKI